MKIQYPTGRRGSTLPEVMVATLILAVFFSAIFELNAVCLRYLNASKESVAAVQYVQDRGEILRNLAFRDLTTTSFVQSLLGPAANGSQVGQTGTEVVKLRAYPTANGITQFTRSPAGTVALNSSAASLGDTLVQIDVAVTWNANLGNRAQNAQATYIVSNGSKK